MVTFLISSLLLVALIALAIYFWQKPAKYVDQIKAPPNGSHGLFDHIVPAQLSSPQQETDAKLIERAGNGDFSALLEAHTSGNTLVYHDVLNRLLQTADSRGKLQSLASYVTRNELSVNRELAEAVIESSTDSLDRSSTAKMLHIAALSGDAATYQHALEAALREFQNKKLLDISPLELQALFTGEFWVLSSRARSSGAGFILKRALASARRQLDT
jgi:hypothetical protein